jgi:hypothetical protein
VDWNRPALIEKVQNRQYRMPVDHARAGIPHYFLYFHPHFRFVAVYRAFTTNGLVFGKEAFFKPFPRIFR